MKQVVTGLGQVFIPWQVRQINLQVPAGVKLLSRKGYFSAQNLYFISSIPLCWNTVHQACTSPSPPTTEEAEDLAHGTHHRPAQGELVAGRWRRQVKKKCPLRACSCSAAPAKAPLSPTCSVFRGSLPAGGRGEPPR